MGLELRRDSKFSFVLMAWSFSCYSASWPFNDAFTNFDSDSCGRMFDGNSGFGGIWVHDESIGLDSDRGYVPKYWSLGLDGRSLHTMDIFLGPSYPASDLCVWLSLLVPKRTTCSALSKRQEYILHISNIGYERRDYP